MATAVWLVLMSGCAAGPSGVERTASEPSAPPAAGSGRPRAMPTVNEVCPITARPVQPHAPVALYQGLALGFCSRECVRPWMDLPDREKRRRIGAVAPYEQLRRRGPPPRDPFR